MKGDVKGAVAVSAAGRDKGRRFAVIGVADDAHVLLSDGESRKAAHPKRKKLKHLLFTGERIADIEAILTVPGGAADARLRGALKALKDDHDNNGADKEG